jgi:hypothetical protein
MEALTQAVVFLLNEYLERARLRMESHISTGEQFRDDVVIVESSKKEANRISQQISRAEALLADLQR